MNENDVFVRNLTEYPDKFLYRLYNLGGIGAFRFGETVWFLRPGEGGGYLTCYHEEGRLGLEKVELVKGFRNSELIEKLARCAEQLFHVRFPPAMDITDVMHGAERAILTYFPPRN